MTASPRLQLGRTSWCPNDGGYVREVLTKGHTWTHGGHCVDCGHSVAHRVALKDAAAGRDVCYDCARRYPKTQGGTK